MKCLFVAVVFFGMVLAEEFREDPVWNLNFYAPTFGMFGNFWDNGNPDYQPSSIPGATCDQVFGHNAEWIISACQSHPDGQYVRSGCFFQYDREDGTGWSVNLMITETPCPKGTKYCGNFTKHRHYGDTFDYPQMYARCS